MTISRGETFSEIMLKNILEMKLYMSLQIRSAHCVYVCVYIYIYIYMCVCVYIYLELELLGHMVVLFLIFWGTTVLFSIITISIYFATSSAQGFPFTTFSPTLVISCLFYNNHSNRWEVISHHGLICISMMISDFLVSFMYLLVICLLWRNFYLGLLPISKSSYTTSANIVMP